MGIPWCDEQAMPMDVLEVVADMIREEQREVEKATSQRR